MKKFVLVLAILTGVLFTGGAWACDKAQCPMGEGSSMCPKAGGDENYPCPIVDKAMKKVHFYLENWEEIGLSEEQVDSIKGIKLWFKKQMVRGQADMEIMMLDMQSKLGEDTLDQAGINTMIDEGMAGMAKSAKDSVEAYAKLRAVLTPDQVAKAKEIWKKK